MYVQALEASGNIDGAIGEFKQAVVLEPSDPRIQLKLAAALEKKRDWPAAIDQYHKAALLDGSIDLRTKSSARMTPFLKTNMKRLRRG